MVMAIVYAAVVVVISGLIAWWSIASKIKLRKLRHQSELTEKQKKIDKLQADLDATVRVCGMKNDQLEELKKQSKSWVDASLDHRLKAEDLQRMNSKLVSKIRTETEGAAESLEGAMKCVNSILELISVPKLPPPTLIDAVNEEKRRMLEKLQEESCSPKNN